MDHEQLRLAVATGVEDAAELTKPRAIRLLRLRRLDTVPRTEIRARALAQLEPRLGYTVPRPFLCTDNRVWWLKAKSQQGLAVEVIAGRLAAAIGAGPMAAPVFVGSDAIGGQLGLLRFEGNVAGVLHRPGAESSKALARFLGPLGIQVPIDQVSRAVTVAFQTWLDVGDPQVLVNMLTGSVESHDHGDTFGTLAKGPPSRVVIAPIPGVPNHVGLTRENLEAAVRRIESLSEDDILEAVAAVPDESGWRGGFARRLAIAEWLLKRQPRLREVLVGWGRLPS